MGRESKKKKEERLIKLNKELGPIILKKDYQKVYAQLLKVDGHLDELIKQL
jgi:hypothetical protein